ncbi:MAG: HlyD family secretion protein [Alphaproteobacteria bacterium]|nr:HlyD family secretion protein [Alphaproteobacteria bacterium]
MDATTPPKDRPKDRPKESTVAKLRGTVSAHPYVSAAIVVIVLALIGAIAWWRNARHFESTDDAFIDARITQVSAQVNGAIVAVPVTDNQEVEAGAVLIRLDDRDYRAALAQAKAQVAQAQANIANLTAQLGAQQARIDQAKKQVEEAQGALTFAREENQRYQELLKTGTGTQQRAQQAASDLRQREAAFAGAQANAIAADKQMAVLRTQRDAADATLSAAQAGADQAQANLDRTVILAPVAGRVTKLTAAKGGYAQTGQSQMAFVPRETWVTANFKETQLADMRVGQGVDISVDAYPRRTFHGHVDSIQAGSGAAFSLLPPENATGNYVKVVQRVPVKIVFDSAPDVPLGPGMSVTPQVRVR